jgi:hypothetical protein
MSEKKCPSEAELISFVDADLSPEQLSRIEKHLETCSSCAKQVIALTTLVEDVGAPLAAPPLDVTEHLAGVMKRLDTPLERSRWSRVAWWGGSVAAAAAALLFFSQFRTPKTSEEEGFAARGGPSEASLSRHVGVQLYAQQTALVPLGSGSRIGKSTPLTAGLRNLAGEPAYLLLFAVDSKQAVHWIAPEYTQEGENPAATPVVPSPAETLLPSVAVFDDLAAGPLRVVAVLSRRPLHVADVESLPASELTAEKLLRRLPRAEIRQFLLEVQAN